MGLFARLFRSAATSTEPMVATALPPQAAAAPESDPVDNNFATAEWVLTKAFDQVMASVEFAPDKRQALFMAYAAAHRAGDTRAEERAATSALLGSGWRWGEFEAWAQRFAAAKEWPYMWEHFSELSESAPIPPITPADALALLNVEDMKAIAKELSLMPRPAPRKRVEFEALLVAHVPLPELLRRTRERHIAAITAFHERYEIAKCRLLVHTLDMTAYSIRDDEQRKRAGHKSTLRAIADAGCPVEDRFAAQFNAGEISGLPPFFPGDRTTIL